jgi:O-antigen ligase
MLTAERAVRVRQAVADAPVRPPVRVRWFVSLAILLAIVLQRFVSSDSDTGGSLPAQLIWGLIYIAAVAGLIANRRQVAPLIRCSPEIVAIVLLALASCVWSDDPGLTLRRSVGLAGTTALAYYVVARFGLDEFIDLLANVTAIAVVLNLVAIFVTPDFGLMQDEYAGAYRGIFAHKNTCGLFLSLGIVTMILRAGVRRVPTIVTWGVIALAFFELLGTRSITAVLVLACCCSVMTIIAVRTWPSRRRAFVVVAGVAVTTVATFLAVISGVDLDTVFSILGRDASLTGRTDIWPGVARAVGDRVVLGYGYDVFWASDGAFQRYIPNTGGWRPFHAHNGYLELALDLGLVGVVLFVCLMGRGFAGALALIRRSTLVWRSWPLMAMISCLVLNLAESYIAKYNSSDWIVLVVAALFATKGEDAEHARVARR